MISYEENIIDSLVDFFKNTFNLYYDVEDFYDTSLYPFFKAEYVNKDCISISFPIKSSIEHAELRVSLKNLRGFSNINFNNIVFDYNKYFEKEVLEINKLSVEDVFENMYLLSWVDKICFVIMIIY